MFGYDDKQLEAIRKRRPIRWWLVALELIVLLVGLSWSALLYTFSTPEGFNLFLEKLLERSPTRITVTDVSLTSDSPLWDPRRWTLLADGVNMTSIKPGKPTVTADRVVLGMPNIAILISERRIQWGDVRLVNLVVSTPQQRAPEAWEVKQPAITHLSASHVLLWGGSFRAAPDAPLPEARAEGLWGSFTDIDYALGDRLLNGTGKLRMKSWRTGTLEVSRVLVDKLDVKDSALTFSGSVSYASSPATVNGTIADFHIKSRTHLQVVVKGADVGDTVTRATGKPSPILGRFDAVLDIRSGGDIPRGSGFITGKITLHDGRIPLGAGIPPIMKDAIRILPWISLDERDQVQLGRIDGEVLVTRGTFALERLVYQAPGRTLHARGYVDGTGKAFLLRVPPKDQDSRKPGIGVFIEGTDKLRVRLASPRELLDNKPDAMKRVVTKLSAPVDPTAPVDGPNLFKRLVSPLKQDKEGKREKRITSQDRIDAAEQPDEAPE